MIQQPTIAYKVAICVLARNCAGSLPANIERIERLRSLTTQSEVVVVENDSIDATKEILSAWLNTTDGITLISNDYGLNAGGEIPRGCSRIERMARYRNICMEHIERIEPDIVVVIDIDVEDFDVNGIACAIAQAPSDWGALFANGNRYLWGNCAPFFYDLYAYLPLDGPISRTIITMRHDERYIRRHLRSEPYLQCRSAFGGLGVYKYEAIKGNRYSVMANVATDGEVLCEHISFNLAIRGQCYIARAMSLRYPRRTIRGFIWQNLAPDAIFARYPKFI